MPQKLMAYGTSNENNKSSLNRLGLEATIFKKRIHLGDGYNCSDVQIRSKKSSLLIVMRENPSDPDHF